MGCFRTVVVELRFHVRGLLCPLSVGLSSRWRRCSRSRRRRLQEPKISFCALWFGTPTHGVRRAEWVHSRGGSRFGLGTPIRERRGARALIRKTW